MVRSINCNILQTTEFTLITTAAQSCQDRNMQLFYGRCKLFFIQCKLDALFLSSILSVDATIEQNLQIPCVIPQTTSLVWIPTIKNQEFLAQSLEK